MDQPSCQNSTKIWSGACGHKKVFQVEKSLIFCEVNFILIFHKLLQAGINESENMDWENVGNVT